MEKVKTASIVVTTKNQAYIIGETMDALLNQDYPEEAYEIIVMNDGSTDETKEILESYEKKITVINTEHQGAIKNKNIGIRKSKNRYVIMLGADCIPDRNWLKTLLGEFTSDNIGFVSAFDVTGGTSTAYDKKVLDKVGLNDLSFNEKGTGFRDDTDLAFRIWDAGYKSIFNYKAKFKHEHKTPPTLKGKLKYGWNRIKIHRFDPLLYKKHPERTVEFLDIKLGFIRNPVRDFQVATGTWAKGGKFRLSSPQGIVLIEKKSPLHAIVIVVGGIIYVVVVKFMRLYGSMKYRKLLI